MRWGSLRVLGDILHTAFGGHFYNSNYLFCLYCASVGSDCGTDLAWIAEAESEDVLSIIFVFGNQGY
jgi:hypothetical protein